MKRIGLIDVDGGKTFPNLALMKISAWHKAQVRGRSGLNRDHGIVVPTGTIDADYRGEIRVVVYNLSREPYIIKPGDRIAQLVISPCIRANWEEVEILNTTGINREIRKQYE